jgi:hypothetical protein
MVLAAIIDPVALTQQNKLLMYMGEGKTERWFASSQDVTLTYIAGQEINSVFTAWGTDGQNLFPLFNTPSTAFTKTAQTKLWDEPGGYEAEKADTRLWSLWQCYTTSGGTNFTIDIDAVGIDGSGNQFTNTQPYTITGPTGTGLFVMPPQAIGQQGVLTGMTIITNAKDMALISAKIGSDIVGFRG